MMRYCQAIGVKAKGDIVCVRSKGRSRKGCGIFDLKVKDGVGRGVCRKKQIESFDTESACACYEKVPRPRPRRDYSRLGGDEIVDDIMNSPHKDRYHIATLQPTFILHFFASTLTVLLCSAALEYLEQ